MYPQNLWFVEPGKTYLFIAIGRFIIAEVEEVSPVGVKLKKDPSPVWVRQTGNNPTDMYRTGRPQEYFAVPCVALYFHDLQSVDEWKHPIPS